MVEYTGRHRNRSQGEGLRLRLGIRARVASAIERYWLRVPPRSANPYSTHLPVLAAIPRLLSVKRVIELGPGLFSTPTFLDRGAYPELLELVSVENDPVWARRVHDAIGSDSRWTLRLVEGRIASVVHALSLDDVDLLLVDDSASEVDRVATLRAVAARRTSAVVVVHDFEVPAYRKATTGFRASYRFRSLNPSTGVLWNGDQVSARQLRGLDKRLRLSDQMAAPRRTRTERGLMTHEKTGKRILVTGGAGTVGAGLVAELTSRGHFVASCDRSHRHDEVGFSLRTDVPSASYARCDVGEFRQLERVFERFGPFDYVYHCAAEFGRWNGEDFYDTLWRTNAVGTKNVVRLQERLRFRLVHFSSSEVYGDWDGVMSEAVMDQHEVKQLNDYAMSKWVNEMQIRNSATQFQTETVVVRLFNTYGPGEYYSPYRSVNCRFLYCALKGLPWVVFRGHTRSSTYLADTVRTLANIVDQFKAGEVYNIGGDQEHSIEQLSETILRVTGASPGLVDYRDSELLTTRYKRVDTGKAIRDLGHTNSYSLEAGLTLTARWMCRVYDVQNDRVSAQR